MEPVGARHAVTGIISVRSGSGAPAAWRRRGGAHADKSGGQARRRRAVVVGGGRAGWWVNNNIGLVATARRRHKPAPYDRRAWEGWANVGPGIAIRAGVVARTPCGGSDNPSLSFAGHSASA